jgi:alkylation response protein AidB-like acyl-CoA dehydrogenase
MHFAFANHQVELRQAARDYLGSTHRLDRAAEIADSPAGWEPSSWRELAELGWLGVTVPEEQGGAGLGFVEQAILLEELGYSLYSGPYLVTVALGLPALAPVDAEAVASGGVRWSAEVDGLVPELGRVDRVLTANGPVAPEGEAVGGIDPTRPMGRLTTPYGTAAALDTTRIDAACAAEALGVAQHALDLAVGYAKEREQFGRRVGAYQAVAHPLADSYGDIELTRSLVYWAAWAIDNAPVQAALAAAAANAAATEAAVRACERAIQAHGGIGFTWEHPLHRFYRRAQWLAGFRGFAPARFAQIGAAVTAAAELLVIERGSR